MPRSRGASLSLTIVQFLLGPHRCALPIEELQEVLRIVAVTHFPRAPGFVEGVIDLRGVVLPVIDMRKRFGLAPGPFDSETRIIIAPLRGRRTGLIVDHVSQVASIDAAHMGIDPSESLGLNMHYVRRVVKMDEHLVSVLDLDKILTDEEWNQFEDASPGKRHV